MHDGLDAGVGWGWAGAVITSSAVRKQMIFASCLCNLKTSLSTTNEECVVDARKKNEKELVRQ